MIRVNWSAIIIILLLGFLIFLQLRSCDEKETPDIAPILEAIEQNKNDIAEINTGVMDIKVSMDSLANKRFETINNYNYEVSQFDSVYPYSTIAKWDSVILAWTDSIYSLEGFFSVPIDKDEPVSGSKDSSAGSELLQTNGEPERRTGLGENSSW